MKEKTRLFFSKNWALLSISQWKCATWTIVNCCKVGLWYFETIFEIMGRMRRRRRKSQIWLGRPITIHLGVVEQQNKLNHGLPWDEQTYACKVECFTLQELIGASSSSSAGKKAKKWCFYYFYFHKYLVITILWVFWWSHNFMLGGGEE